MENPRLRAAVTWALTLGVYLPLVGLGRALSPLGWGRHVPLYDFYGGKSVRRIRQDVYDRFFTRIEQRFRRAFAKARAACLEGRGYSVK